jgi:hypothetical protein
MLMTTPSPGYETDLPFITAWAEIGSASSRNPPGRRHNLRLSGPRQSVIVVAGLSETAARRGAELINEFLADVVYHRSAPQPTTCLHCGATIRPSGQGRPPRYCSPACRQHAYRDRTRH